MQLKFKMIINPSENVVINLKQEFNILLKNRILLIVRNLLRVLELL